MDQSNPLNFITPKHLAALHEYCAVRVGGKEAAKRVGVPYQQYRTLLLEALHLAGCDRCITKAEKHEGIKAFFVRWVAHLMENPMNDPLL